MAQFLIITEFEDANDFLMLHAFKQQAFLSAYVCQWETNDRRQFLQQILPVHSLLIFEFWTSLGEDKLGVTYSSPPLVQRDIQDLSIILKPTWSLSKEGCGKYSSV